MAWQQIVYLVFAVCGTALSAAQVGKPRDPLEPNVFAVLIVLQALLVWLVLSI